MTEEIVLEDLAKITQELMREKGIDEYDLNIDGKPIKGENYTAILLFFTITYKPGGEVHNFVMKTAERSEERKKALCLYREFAREAYVYSRVFPCFRAFGKKVDSSFKLDYVPEVLWVSQEYNRETMIMENLKTKGYHLLDRTKTMNFEHIKCVLTTYGKLHAVSIALRDQEPETFRKLTENMDNVMIDYCRDYGGDSIFKKDMLNAMALLKKNERQDLVEKYSKIIENIDGYFLKELDKEDWGVITHGDCWNNNLMFFYKGEQHSKPDKMCLLDFQMSMLASPVLDLSYYILTSCDGETLKDLDLLLQIYYDSFRSAIIYFGSSPSIFPFEQLKLHWKKYAAFGIIYGTFLMKLQLVSVADAPDMDDVQDGNDIASVFDINMTNKQEYNQRILDMYISFGDSYFELNVI